MKVRSTVHLRRSLCEPWSLVHVAEFADVEQAKADAVHQLGQQAQADGSSMRELYARVAVWPAGLPTWQEVARRRVVGTETVERVNL